MHFRVLLSLAAVALFATILNAQEIAGPIYVVSYVEVMASQQSAAIAILKQYRDNARKEQGVQEVEVLQQLDRPTHFNVLEIWKDEKAFDNHQASRSKKEFLSKLQPMRTTPYDERKNQGLSVAAVPADLGPNPVVVITHVDTIPPHDNEARGLLKQLASDSRVEQGNVRFDVLQGIRANHFTVIEMWRSQQARTAHAESAHTMKWRDEIHELATDGSPYDERLCQRL